MFKSSAIVGGVRTRVRVALGIAVVWSVGLLVAALTLPAYSGSTSSTSSDGTVTESTTTSTLVEVNGREVLVVLAFPLLASLAVSAILAERRRATERLFPWLDAGAWVVVAACGALVVLGAASIGLFVLPVAAALAVAVTATQRPRVPRPAHP
jgi:hypothetical protein